MLVAFIVLLLYLLNKAARINQTLAAMAGAGSLLGLVAFPLILMQGPQNVDGAAPIALSLVWVALLVWNLMVSAHILRHALSSSFGMGLAVAILYLLISTQFVVTVLPQQADVMPDENLLGLNIVGTDRVRD